MSSPLCFTVEGEGAPLLLLHGFTGSAAAWEPFRKPWARFTRIAVDLLGHGGSPAPPDPGRYRIERSVADVLAVLDRVGIARTAVLGYSMGGRVALRLALAAPERVAALVLESASPGIEDARERARRARSDHELAARLERDGLEAFVDYWEGLPLFASQRRLPASERRALRRQRLRNDPRGLANSLRGLGAGEEEPVLERLPELEMPVLLVAGALDAKYCNLARRMRDALPGARIEIVPAAGHAVHLERPRLFARLVADWLDEPIVQSTTQGRELRPCQ